MIATIAALLVVLPHSAQAQPLKRKIGDREVAVSWPVGSRVRSDLSHFTSEGITYSINSAGRVLGPFVADGAWGEVQKAYEASLESKSTPKNWRLKVMVLSSFDILDTSVQPVRRRTYSMVRPEIDRIYESLALFSALVEARYKGEIKVQVDVDVDGDTVFLNRTLSGIQPDKALNAYVKPRINGHDFEAEDKVYRGPYDGVFVIHGAPTFVDWGDLVWQTPFSSVNFLDYGSSASDLAERLSMEFDSHRRVNERLTLTLDEGYSSRGQSLAPEAPVLFSPSSTLTPDQQHQANLEMIALGGSQTGGARWVVEESLGIVGPGQGTQVTDGKDYAILATPKRLASLFQSSLKPEFDPKPIGWFGDWYLSRVARSAVGKREIDLLTIAPSAGKSPEQVNPGVIFNGKPGAATTGFVELTEADDREKGAVSRFEFIGSSRLGGVTLWDSQLGRRAIDSSKQRYLALNLKAKAAEPLNVVVRFYGQAEPMRWRMFGRWPNSPTTEGLTRELAVSQADAWQTVTIDLLVGSGGRPIESIALEADVHSKYWSGSSAPFDVLLGPATLLDSGTPTPVLAPPVKPTPAPDSPDPEARALWLATAGAGAPEVAANLLTDEDAVVQLNAAMVFSQTKYPAAEAALGELSRNLNARIVEAAMKALAFQDTESAWAMVRRGLDIGPGDTIRMFAAREYAKRKDPLSAGAFAVLFNARSYRARLEAVKALGQIKSREAAMIQIVFIQEANPEIRLAVTEGADITVDQVCRRLLWSCVNDPSDAVRAASYARLTESTVAAYASEGYKGVRDESSFVRLDVLQRFTSRPTEAHRNALRIAVVDPDPAIRAAALRAFEAMPGAVTKEEIESCWNDPDVRVKSALERLKKAKGLGDLLGLAHNATVLF